MINDTIKSNPSYPVNVTVTLENDVNTAKYTQGGIVVYPNPITGQLKMDY